MAPIMVRLLNIILMLLFLFFGSIALGNYLNEVLQSNYWGYVLIAAVFLILGILLLALRRTRWYRKIIDYFTEKIINRLLIREDEN